MENNGTVETYEKHKLINSKVPKFFLCAYNAAKQNEELEDKPPMNRECRIRATNLPLTKTTTPTMVLP